MSSADVAIIGGGAIGCSTARQLALRGRRVIVCEREHVVGFNMETTEETLGRTRKAAERVLPCLVGAPTEARWAGLNDVTLDELPFLGPDPRLPGLFLATGFSGHGMGISPAVGRLMADLIADGRSSYDVEPFRVDRFDHLDIPAELAHFISHHKGGMAIAPSIAGAAERH